MSVFCERRAKRLLDLLLGLSGHLLMRWLCVQELLNAVPIWTAPLWSCLLDRLTRNPFLALPHQGILSFGRVLDLLLRLLRLGPPVLNRSCGCPKRRQLVPHLSDFSAQAIGLSSELLGLVNHRSLRVNSGPSCLYLILSFVDLGA